MAQPNHKETEIAELLRRSEESRLLIARAHASLRHKLDAPARLRDSIKSQPAKWIGGSLGAGFLASFLFRKKSKTPEKVQTLKKQRGFLLGALGIVVTLAKPAAKTYALKILRDYLKKRLHEGSARRPVSRNLSQY